MCKKPIGFLHESYGFHTVEHAKIILLTKVYKGGIQQSEFLTIHHKHIYSFGGFIFLLEGKKHINPSTDLHPNDGKPQNQVWKTQCSEDMPIRSNGDGSKPWYLVNPKS
jgi:hypothetical protein